MQAKQADYQGYSQAIWKLPTNAIFSPICLTAAVTLSVSSNQKMSNKFCLCCAHWEMPLLVFIKNKTKQKCSLQSLPTLAKWGHCWDARQPLGKQRCWEKTTEQMGMPEHIFLWLPWGSCDSESWIPLKGKAGVCMGAGWDHVYQSQQFIWARVQVVCMSKFDEI